MTSLYELARRWMRQSELGRGIRLTAAEHDLLNSLGVGEMLATESAKILREMSRQRAEAAMEREANQREDAMTTARLGATEQAGLPPYMRRRREERKAKLQAAGKKG